MIAGDEPLDVRTSNVDGVPVMWLPVDDVSVTAGLVFRVGRADEQLARAGVSHLLEHLALFEVGRAHPDLRFNGQVDQTTTSFFVEGTPAQVVTFLRDVCQRLHDLPAQRLEVERDILRSESDGRSLSTAPAVLHRWRFGARGYGLVAWEEYGLNQLSIEDLNAWAARFATRGNALVWMTGPPSPDLSLPLPDGQRIVVPGAVDVLPRFPTWFNDGPAPVTAAHSLVARSSAARAMACLLEKRLVQRVRYELGASYSPHVAYEPTLPETAELLVVAEPVAGQEAAVAHEVLTALAAMADGDISSESLTAWRDLSARMPTDDPSVLRGALVFRALARLLGSRDMSAEEVQHEAAAVDATSVAAAAAEAASRALYRIPEDVKAPPGIVQAPVWSPELDAGRRHEERRPSPEGEPHVLCAGPIGVSLARNDGNHVSITAGDVEALLVWPHDLRTVVGSDAATLDINPAYWHDGPELLRDLDAMVPLERHVRMRQDIDAPPGPTGVGEPVGVWLLFVGLLVLLGALVVALFIGVASFTLLPLVLLTVGTLRALRFLQRTRHARGLPRSGWPS